MGILIKLTIAEVCLYLFQDQHESIDNYNIWSKISYIAIALKPFIKIICHVSAYQGLSPLLQGLRQLATLHYNLDIVYIENANLASAEKGAANFR